MLYEMERELLLKKVKELEDERTKLLELAVSISPKKQVTDQTTRVHIANYHLLFTLTQETATVTKEKKATFIEFSDEDSLMLQPSQMRKQKKKLTSNPKAQRNQP